MFGISFAELVIIFLLILVVMGPEKLPEFARWAGKGMRQLRQASNTVRNALAVEDFDQQHPSTDRISDSQTPKSAATGPHPSDASGTDTGSTPATGDPAPPSNIDQVDDQQFDELIEQRVERHGDDLERIELDDAEPATGLVDVELPEPDTTADKALYDVALPTPSHAGTDR